MQKLLDSLLRPMGLPELASVHGRDVDYFILYVHLLMVALFIGWSAFFIYTLWRFRRGRNPRASHTGVTSHASTWLEGAVALIEVVLLVGFAIPLWARAVDDFPDAAKSVNLRITARQFNWMARYPGADGKFGKQDPGLVTTENPLGLLAKNDKTKELDPDGKDDVNIESSDFAVPVDRDILASVTSLDVIHSFKVLPLRMTQDATPGLRVPFHFKATRTNTYQINCAQLCGNGHSTMKGILRVLPQAEFDAWLKSKSGAAAASYE
jgi:cytochrome c oxidase subunit 2